MHDYLVCEGGEFLVLGFCCCWFGGNGEAVVNLFVYPLFLLPFTSPCSILAARVSKLMQSSLGRDCLVCEMGELLLDFRCCGFGGNGRPMQLWLMPPDQVFI